MRERQYDIHHIIDALLIVCLRLLPLLVLAILAVLSLIFLLTP